MRLLTLVAFLALAGSAQATAITIAEISVFAPIPLGRNTSPNLPVPFTVQGFDPALGLLVGLRCDIEMHEMILAQGENESPAPAVLEWKTRTGFRVSALDSTVLFHEQFPERTFGLRCAPFDGATDFGGSSGFTVPLKAVLQDYSAYVTARPFELARFVGPGPRTFLATRTGSNLFSANTGNTTAVITHKLWARFVVTYVYVPAPTG